MQNTGTLSLQEEMDCLEGDLHHLMCIQNQHNSELDRHGFPVANHLSEEIGRLERVWGCLYMKQRGHCAAGTSAL
jgi:hypothetical protein